MRISRSVATQQVFYRDDLATEDYNPNAKAAVSVLRYVRVTPLAGAALWPVTFNLLGQARQEVFSGPAWHDLGQADRMAILPLSFGAAFSPSSLISPNQSTNEYPVLPCPIATPPPALEGWPVASGMPIGLSGYISGAYLIESTDTLDAVLSAQSSPQTSSPWLAAYRAELSLTQIDFNSMVNLGAPWVVPDYAPGPIDQAGFDGEFEGFFLGCGARVVRYSFFDLASGGGSPFPATFRKYILGPFSQEPEAAGVITVDTADSMVSEETINIDTPLWLYLVRDDSGGGSYGVTIQVSRQPHA